MGSKTISRFFPLFFTEAMDKIFNKKLDGYSIEFVEDANKNIIGVLFIQPNGTFKATKKQVTLFLPAWGSSDSN